MKLGKLLFRVVVVARPLLVCDEREPAQMLASHGRPSLSRIGHNQERGACDERPHHRRALIRAVSMRGPRAHALYL